MCPIWPGLVVGTESVLILSRSCESVETLFVTVTALKNLKKNKKKIA